MNYLHQHIGPNIILLLTGLFFITLIIQLYFILTLYKFIEKVINVSLILQIKIKCNDIHYHEVFKVWETIGCHWL